MAFEALSWHRGEELMHQRLHVPSNMNPNVPMLSQQAARTLQQASLLAVGTLDSELRPWTTVWGGGTGFARPLGQSIIGVRTPVAAKFDPVVESLVGASADGKIVKDEGLGRMVSGLTIDLATRKRVKLYGRMVAGALSSLEQDETDGEASPGNDTDYHTEIQLVVRIEQSLGNCPKYINTKTITPAQTVPRLISESSVLSDDALALVARSDMLFLSSRHEMNDMDTNHRGGPPGFVRVVSDNTTTSLVWPEYSGNRLYQNLGNLQITPLAGLCFPDFITGDVLYLTGTTDILIGSDAADVLPRSNLAVKLTVTASRLVSSGLAFRGDSEEYSPYNPQVRYLKSERKLPAATSKTASNYAKLLAQTRLTPSISRFRFSLSNPTTYTAGQYATFDFSSHLDIGYSHMRNDDPLSINDDFIRTFTVSNPPRIRSNLTDNLQDDEFEITIRKVGPVTDFLFKHGLGGRQSHLEVDLNGFGGSFRVEHDDGERIGFVAGGVGITPLLPALSYLNPKKLVVLWAVRRNDLGLATDVLRAHPEFTGSFNIFGTGPDNNDTASNEAELASLGATVERRRLGSEDLSEPDSRAIKRWFLCTNTPMRESLLTWMGDKETIYEDFNF